MSQAGQHSTALLIERGGDVEAVDTYGFRPLHRMASNNLPVGAAALLRAGADAGAQAGRGGTALAVAQSSSARAVVKVLSKHAAGEEI
mmetsp:Transcript_122830/g.281685  ORF Transcript_122830/g.281685 Transcript_122830/m.281685 type:complete len:88 (-) Transcript_122830:15-278(-)